MDVKEMDVKEIIRERRLREVAEELRHKSTNASPGSANHQSKSSVQRISGKISARSSRPSSQFGDAESPPEWYQHEEGNHTHLSILNFSTEFRQIFRQKMRFLSGAKECT